MRQHTHTITAVLVAATAWNYTADSPTDMISTLSVELLVAEDGTGSALPIHGDGSNQPAACQAAEHRQFDFWIGRWEVRNPGGAVVGTNVIESIHGGCVLRESWSGRSGSEGNSYNIYYAPGGRWHQTWVDNTGTLLLLDGGLDDAGAMVLEGEMAGRDGRPARHRIAWTPLGPDRIRQLWVVSRDGGENWETLFDGDYRRVLNDGVGMASPRPRRGDLTAAVRGDLPAAGDCHASALR
jgi:hypothetical protein